MVAACRRTVRGSTMADNIKIRISNLYKVFGNNPGAAMNHVRNLSLIHISEPTRPY